MTNDTKKTLAAKNLALTTALSEAITEYKDAIAYKSEYLVEKHKDVETIAELEEILTVATKDGHSLLKHLQADAIETLKFPTELRKMWSGQEVQEWIANQAEIKRKK